MGIPITKQTFPAICEQRGLPRPEVEWKFSAERQWKFDYCWPQTTVYMRNVTDDRAILSYGRLALEIDGSVWKKGKDGKVGGRHNRPQGFLNDMEKLNAAALMGWFVIRCSTDMFASGEGLRLVLRAFGRG